MPDKRDYDLEHALLNILGSFDTISRYMDYEIRKLGSRPIRASILYLLNQKEDGRMTPTQLSDVLFRAQGTITSAVNTMEKEGLVKRERSRIKDGRSIPIVITNKGIKRIKELDEAAGRIAKTLLHPWNKKEVQKLEKDLNRIRKYLIDLIGSPRKRADKKRIKNNS